MKKREPTTYTLWVDGKAVQTFTRKPPRAVRAMVGSKGITITPAIEDEKRKPGESPQIKQLSLFGEEP